MLKSFSCILQLFLFLMLLYSKGSAEETEPGKSLLSLAQGCRDLAQYRQAIELYQSRISQGGDTGETWFCKYMIAECHELLGEWEDALYWYLEAFQQKPDRKEPLLKLSRHYRYLGANELAYLFAKHGSLIPHLKNPLPEVPDPLTTWDFDQELSIAAYYTRFRQEGAKAVNDLILKKNVPGSLKDNAYQNLLFYIQNLRQARYTPIHAELPLIQIGSEERYHPMNPSIIKTQNGYRLILRAVNYTQEGAKVFNTTDPTGVFRTKNFLICYDRNFEMLSQQEIVENLPREKVRAFNVEGMEDCRLFEHQGKLGFSCTTFDTHPRSTVQVSLCSLRDAADAKELHVEKLLPLQGPDPNRCEKNWLPFLYNGQIHLVYSSDPFLLYRPDLETGECHKVLCVEPPLDLSRFRGSAAPIPFDGGYLMLVHEVAYLQDYFRCYLHRFVYLDRDFVLQKLSDPFTFLHRGVEFCLSMTVDHSGKELILPIGFEDRQAFLCFVELDTVRSLLLDINPFNNEIDACD